MNWLVLIAIVLFCIGTWATIRSQRRLSRQSDCELEKVIALREMVVKALTDTASRPEVERQLQEIRQQLDYTEASLYGRILRLETMLAHGQGKRPS